MVNVVLIVQIILGILMIVLVSMQSKNLGSGAVFGGGSDSFQTTRRGFEKTLFNLTLAVSVIFFIVSLIAAVVF